MRGIVVTLICVLAFGAVPAMAQDRGQTLADIRQELTVLYVEMQRLKRELSTTGAPMANLAQTDIFDRVAAIEAELQRLTAETEQLSYRIDRIVKDGTNRIGDLEFRLVELEGGDVSKLGETTTLGGDPDMPLPLDGSDGQGPEMELAVGEQADFDAANKALEEGDYQTAIDLFTRFDAAYPGSPLAPQANLARGRALAALGNTREAARAYLASFTGDPAGVTAPEALYELGAALGQLGQTAQACITLGEVGARFPSSDAVSRAREEMDALGCS